MINTHSLYRNSDPVSSRLAVENNKSTIKTHRDLVHDLLQKHEGLTSAELGVFLGEDRHYWRGVASRRLADLCNEGLAHQGDTRKCTVTKQVCVTWYAQEQREETEQLCLSI
jgi:hypothetical protein